MTPSWAEQRKTYLVGWLVGLAVLSCVVYDPAGPPVPRIDGTYATRIVVSLANEVEIRSDTFAAEITLRGTGYRGQFVGTYHIASDDSGPIGGAEILDGSLTVMEFGTPPKPIAGVASIVALYPWCDFPRLGTGPMPGSLRADTLVVDGRGSVPCIYQVGGQVLNRVTEVRVQLAGVR